MTPRISIVTICRNALTGLKATVNSTLQQRYENFEQIIIDGASTDGTQEYLATLTDERIQWISEPDKGIYDAMNKGAQRATGEWVIFMNACDCFANADVLSKVFAQCPDDAEIVYGDVIKGETVKVAQPPHNSHRMFFCHQCVFVRTALAREYPFDTSYRLSSDFKFFKQMILQHRHFVHVNLPVAVFDTTGASNTHRSTGLLENIRIVRQMDPLSEQLRLLPHLIFPYLLCKLRNK